MVLCGASVQTPREGGGIYIIIFWNSAYIYIYIYIIKEIDFISSWGIESNFYFLEKMHAHSQRRGDVFLTQKYSINSTQKSW